jgi:hypothetical protein
LRTEYSKLTQHYLMLSKIRLTCKYNNLWFCFVKRSRRVSIVTIHTVHLYFVFILFLLKYYGLLYNLLDCFYFRISKWGRNSKEQSKKTL